MLKALFPSGSDVELKLEEYAFGGAAIEAVGEPLPANTLKACQEADAILLGNNTRQ